MEDLQINMTQEEAERIMRKRKPDGLGKILGKLFFQNTIKAVTDGGTTFVNHDKLIDKGFNLPEEEALEFVWYYQVYYWIRHTQYKFLFAEEQTEFLAEVLQTSLANAYHAGLARDYESNLPDGAPELPKELTSCTMEQVFDDYSDGEYIDILKTNIYCVKAFNETISALAEQGELPELAYYKIDTGASENLLSAYNLRIRTLKEYYKSDPDTLKRIGECFPLIKPHKIKVPEYRTDEIRSLVENPNIFIAGKSYNLLDGILLAPEFDD